MGHRAKGWSIALHVKQCQLWLMAEPLADFKLWKTMFEFEKDLIQMSCLVCILGLVSWMESKGGGMCISQVAIEELLVSFFFSLMFLGVSFKLRVCPLGMAWHPLTIKAILCCKTPSSFRVSWISFLGVVIWMVTAVMTLLALSRLTAMSFRAVT